MKKIWVFHSTGGQVNLYDMILLNLSQFSISVKNYDQIFVVWKIIHHYPLKMLEKSTGDEFDLPGQILIPKPMIDK